MDLGGLWSLERRVVNRLSLRVWRKAHRATFLVVVLLYPARILDS